MKKNLLSILLVLASFLAVEAQNWWKSGIRGEGNNITEEVRLDKTIEGVRNSFSCDVLIEQGSRQLIRMEGQENILDNLILEVDGDGTLAIKSDRPVRNHRQVTIHITMSKLRVAKVTGSGNLKTKNTFSDQGDLHVAVSGSGNVDIDVEADDVKSRITGSGNVTLTGSARTIDAGITGSGDLRAYNLRADVGEITVTGSGSAQLNIDRELDAKVTGSGNVHYRGNVRDVDSRVTGSGSVRSAR